MSRRRVAVTVAGLLLCAVPVAAAATPAPAVEVAPAGTVIVVIMVSDGLVLSPYATGVVPPTACLPVAS